NYSYIANLRPSIAFIVDIRRQNAMLHLMYKALFEMSPSRPAFVANLFARPLPGRMTAAIDATHLFEAARTASPSRAMAGRIADSIIALLVRHHGFALSRQDQDMIRRVYDVFSTAGPDVNYSWRSNGRPRGSSAYVTFAMLQTATSADGTPMAFLAT